VTSNVSGALFGPCAARGAPRQRAAEQPSQRVFCAETVAFTFRSRPCIRGLTEDAWRELHGRGRIAPVDIHLRTNLVRLLIAVAERGQRDPTKLRAYAVTFLRMR
jgi:hypothetical protein